MTKKAFRIIALVVILSMALPFSVFAQKVAAPSATVDIHIFHTNDFHGNLELVPSSSTVGMARTANVIFTAMGTDREDDLLLDAGDIMQGSLLSNLQKGVPTIDVYRAMGYNAVTFGNHEFDWNQTVLGQRVAQANAAATSGRSPFDFLSANIVSSSDCSTAQWDLPSFVNAPYEIFDVGPTSGTKVKVAVIGVTTTEVPFITLANNTAGICFKDPASAISHYYPSMKNDGADVIVVLSHLGLDDGGYGYGFPVYGDKTLAEKLNAADTPVDVIIGGHSHTNMTAAVTVGNTKIAQAYYAGRAVGEWDISVDSVNHSVSSATWQKLAVTATEPEDTTISGIISEYVNDPDYQATVNEPIGYSNVDLIRNYNGDSLMGEFIQDMVYYDLNNDSVPQNDADIVFNNAGGIRSDLSSVTKPFLLTYGMLYSVLPFGNQTAVGDMNGAQILDILNQSATLFKGAIQVSGIRYKFYKYVDSVPNSPQPWAWGAYDVTVKDRVSGEWKPLDANKTYRVATNEFLAPAGQDGYSAFKYMTNISYWGDMLNGVDRAVAELHSTETTAYNGPTNQGTVDGRITREGDDTTGPVVPVTVLHHNDSHGRLLKNGDYQGLTQLATVINQERQHNPDRTLLFNLGDSIQGDSMSYYFKNAGQGTTADGTPLPPDLWINPFIAAMNAMGYNGMVLGNHEFNFGAGVFDSTFAKAAFPLLGANMSDDGAYGVNKVGLDDAVSSQGVKINVYDGLEFTLASDDPGNPIHVGFLGLTNHRVPNYELPSNIPGLHFYDPIETATTDVPVLKARNDAVVALTHIGFTEDPKSVEVDKNVDTNLAAEVPGIDAIIGGHSHTNPKYGYGDYKYLPAFVAGPDGKAVLVNQAYRYNTFLGEVVLGFKPKDSGGFDLVSTAGRDIAIDATTTPEDPTVKAIVDPYQTIITNYNNTEIGQTEVPIDTLNAFKEETNGANLQADASVYVLEKAGINVDFHLSGAMTNKKIADAATQATPYTLKVSDMFNAMPYENSLLVLKMNGPQLKAVLERAYRNYYYYKYVPGYGGYSHYTTCMIDTDKNNVITYADTYPRLPDGNNVVSLVINGKPVNFNDASKYYNVSTVNYLAAGSCNFNDDGVSLWPLNQIVSDTQLYVRDAVIDYVKAQTAPIAPAIENRLVFSVLDKFLFFPSVFR